VTSSAQDDARWLDAVRRGDEGALARLYERHGGRLLTIGRRLLRDDQAAEDVVHDVFVMAWRDAAKFDPNRGSVRTWLCVRMRSRCLDELRKRTVRDAASDRVPEPQPLSAPTTTMLDADRLPLLLERLPPVQAQAVRLRYLEGLTSAEAATAAGCPVGTLKSRLRGGLSALRDLLEIESTP